MDCSTLPPTAREDNITDDMLDLYAEDALVSAMHSTNYGAGSPNTGALRLRQFSTVDSASCSLRPNGHLGPLALGTVRPAEAAAVGPQSSSSLMGLESMENIVFQRQSRRTNVQQRPSLDDNASVSNITSDDSGDFGFLTSDARDADAYDAIRDYLVYCKQQEKDLEELEEECAQLEAEQQLLYGAAVAVKMTKRGSLAASSASPLCADGAVSAGASPRVEGDIGCTAQSVAEEFAEEDIDPLNPCPYVDACTGGKTRALYRYGPPSFQGDYKPVFKNGFLYRCATREGLWVFYNDSQKYQMHVRYIFGATSTLAAGPHASLKQLRPGEVELAVTVWPQETEVLLQGEVNGFKNLSVATPVDASYVNTHTAASTATARALLSRYARQSGKSSVTMLTSEDVLDCCFKGNKNGPTKGSSGGASAGASVCHYVDPAFPPCSASIYRHDVDDIFLWDMPWRRPADYLPKKQIAEACLFAGAALPTDPSSGDGGDAYLSSAASLLAEHPDSIYKLFRHPTSADAGRKARTVGAYHVTLGHGGWWTSTVVDDYLPASLRGPDMGRCAHDLRKLWYPLLEKAYAKLHGSYAAIQCGDPLEALQDFTGFPTFRFDEEWAEVAEKVKSSLSCFPNTAETERLFDMLEAKVNACGYLVCLSLPDEGPTEAKQMQMGMVYGSSYAVLRVVRYEDYRLVQVRCPTMRLDGDGLWSAESVRWRQEPELAKLCGMRTAAGGSSDFGVVGDDGGGDSTVFDEGNDVTPGGLWLDWSEALLMFEGGGVCCSHWDWTEDCRVRGAFHNGIPSLALEVRVEAADGEEGEAAGPVEAYCVLSQEDDRGLPPDHPNRALQPLMLCVSSVISSQDALEPPGRTASTQCICLACSTDPDSPTEQLSYILGRDTALRTAFEPSAHPYYIIPRSLGETSNKLFTVGIISSTPVTKNGRLRVRAVQLPSDSPVFENQWEFSTAQVTGVAAAAFQLRGADGRVRVGCGSSIG
ncbi:putative calpain-like cysteine peptidase putativecysteine peptidase Clan CA family C2 [Leptomonas pyrrhocoris]|uniref:Putative calpain-like cysteine peptidase putativecysteine peptidase Clan CA family C2 n=1 Tax=Leptomonas pyrrhocoris TaxID=157538 RepID=A0A0N0VCW1_LEPPY|nr:putative calpain-like cysteine peptidase putativecysteine peptidase Clan CA family C2 [Leptomonas pyrrhocoris]XP_015652383.1 putative calpain-like cysteine peptidase putativecysteine peptidase Clan CA family C2 [Leptomonas pyrrhocoris]XP_015652384.1 putative calpain-like cysteine peptidase putativecysteine peptidase Clan CA family C2 [Leptomonas pyrrhocoris]KPA73943.1 putative calpain-like cysteine peptidase putativecysteine peptidase Clan CA family C2 [Leptomonas pyrrhocoris]KPA73944.1 puta|eukprot:XP_015652382.1 putative calpain-like cysteine peptidase putativecysteine peptidase Clan CA family C2 [Leptomonas pyrrhocoris]